LPRPLVAAAMIAAGIALAFSAIAVSQVSLHKYFSIDEFQYSHAAWLVARGEIPYRDFYQHYMPLLYHWLALPFVLGAKSPTAIVALRLILLPFLAISLWAVYRVNRTDGRWAIFGPLFLLSVRPFVDRAIEIRPDGMATALFFLALALLQVEKIDPRRRALLAGACAAASVLASQKALYYGLAFSLGLAIDLFVNRRRRVFLLADPARFCAAAAGVLGMFLLYLVITGAWAGWVEHSLSYSVRHQINYPGFPFLETLSTILPSAGWLFVLAAVGVIATIWRLANRGPEATSDPDLLLLGALASTFASFALTRAPYVYCLVPFFPALCAFSARGAAALGRWLLVGRLAPALAILAVSIAGLQLGQAYADLAPSAARGNAHQVEVLRRIGTLTRPDEPVFDLAGAGVTRPHVLFHYYADRLQLELWSRELERETPEALRRAGCVLLLVDRRFERLSPGLRNYLLAQYQPYDGDLRIWGRRYRPMPGRLFTDSFYAIRDGRYFVWPPTALTTGTLRIDGRPVPPGPFSLHKGIRVVEYSGAATDLSVLWLPADDAVWRPRPGLPPRFSIL
jgi:hypothetical protein